MYLDYFGFADRPFSLTPDPRFVYYSRQYREAESQLLYGITNREGFMLVTGQPGTGKTTLCRNLLEKLPADQYHTAFIFNPFLNGTEMLATLLEEFRVPLPREASRKSLLDRLNEFLMQQLVKGRRCVAIFDEAQHLSIEFLEQIRVLSNLETEREKLIQIVLVGQPELLQKLGAPNMAQLDQRVSIRCGLSYLDASDTGRYLQHRLNIAGSRGDVHFTQAAVTELHAAAGGVPRMINLVADRALLAAFSAESHEVGGAHVRKAVQSLRGEETMPQRTPAATLSALPPRRSRRWVAAAVAAGVLLLAAGGWRAGVGRTVSAAVGPDLLYWQGTLDADPARAERALATLVHDFPRSRRLPEAAIRLAQLQAARGDRRAALATLATLSGSTALPDSALRLRVALWTSAIHLDGGDTVGACAAASPAVLERGRRDRSVSALAATVAPVCQLPAANAVARAPDAAGDSTASPPDTGRSTPVAAADAAPAAPFAVQVGAFRSDTAAQRLATTLARRGLAPRVIQRGGAYRVIVGSFTSQRTADSARMALASRGTEGLVVSTAQ